MCRRELTFFQPTADNDGDFSIKEKKKIYKGKSRDRVISEYELDGIYILREDFKEEWESDKVKQFDNIFNDIINLVKSK